MKFTDLNLKPEILAGLAEMGYTDLTPVQEQTVEPILARRDLLARAETGSGKTSACGIPLVQMIDPKLKAVQGLILVPTRELALQYVSELADIARQTDVSCFAVYGGFSMPIQRTKLEHGVHILVATPGRLIDLLYNSPLSLGQVTTFVLDEADEMLNMGFVDDVEFVTSCLVHQHQTLLFSATMPPEIKRLADKLLHDPLYIELNKEKLAPSNLHHTFQVVSGSNKLESLLAYLEQEQPKQAILFCNSRLGAEKLLHDLRGKLDSFEIIHGGLEQSRRTSLFNRFKRQEIKYMIATDVASRGLDFSHVSHVINVSFPRDRDTYTHRTGRTARMGRHGTAMSFVTRGELGQVRNVLRANRIEPIWLGETPDLDARLPKSASGRGFHGRSGSGRGRRPRR